MAYWAELDENNIVIRILAMDNDHEDGQEGYTWLVEKLGGRWLKTSFNTMAGIYLDPQTRQPSENQNKAFRKNYAGIGFRYNEELDAFIPPKPYESWILNDDSCLWEPPLPYPQNGKKHVWDESSVSWVEVTE